MVWSVDYIGTDHIEELANFIRQQSPSTAGVTEPAEANQSGLTAFVYPFIGTGATDKSSLSGSNLPGAILPFGPEKYSIQKLVVEMVGPPSASRKEIPLQEFVLQEEKELDLRAWWKELTKSDIQLSVLAAAEGTVSQANGKP